MVSTVLFRRQLRQKLLLNKQLHQFSHIGKVRTFMRFLVYKLSGVSKRNQRNDSYKIC